MKKLITFAKGKLTVSSIIAYLVAQRIGELPDAFQTGLAGDLSLIDLATVAGATWGVIRKFTKTYKGK